MSDLDGATEPGERLAYPNTPGEFAARWNSWTEERRISWLALITRSIDRREAMSTEPKYIAVEGRVPSIIKRCDDRSCDKYHTWIDLDSSDSFYDAAQIAKAMNLMDAPRPPLTIRDNPAMPDDETLERLFSLAVRDSPSAVVGLRAVWRHGRDAGMVAPESQGSST